MPLYFTIVKYNIESDPGTVRKPIHSEAKRELNMEGTQFLPALGRALIALPFLMSGFGKLAAYGATTAYIASVGLPLPPLGWLIAVAFEVGGGLLLLLGLRSRPVALALAAFTLATAVFFHTNFADKNQIIHFLKNIMIIGGLLQIAHFGAGSYSLDARTGRDGKAAPTAG
ncbi:MAG TPA: DoxX family protein [Rhizomicrobium sp.]